MTMRASGVFEPTAEGGTRTSLAEKNPLVVLVDGRVMQDRYHGIGRYTFELLRELCRREVHLIVLYSPDGGRLDIGELLAQPTVQSVVSRVPIASLRSQWELSRAIFRYRPDVAFVPYHLSTPVIHGKTPVVSVIHDCIFEREAAAYGQTIFSSAYGVVTRLAIHSATTLVAPSQASRRDIGRFYGKKLPADAVLSHGVGAQFFALTGRSRQSETELPGRYILHVGARRPHKNQRVLVEALAKLRRRHPDLHLVLVGQRDERVVDEASELVATLNLSEYVHEFTHADDGVLQDLYANAAVFAYPSLAEGFGMPLLEAMAAGVPVIASDAEAVQEIVGDGALIVSASASDRWVATLDQVLSDEDLARQLRERGLQVAAKHTWASSAERTLALLVNAVNTASLGGKWQRSLPGR